MGPLSAGRSSLAGERARVAARAGVRASAEACGRRAEAAARHVGGRLAASRRAEGGAWECRVGSHAGPTMVPFSGARTGAWGSRCSVRVMRGCCRDSHSGGGCLQCLMCCLSCNISFMPCLHVVSTS